MARDSTLLNLDLNKYPNFTKTTTNNHKILGNLLCFKSSFFKFQKDDLNSFLLFKQLYFFNAYTTAVDSFNQSLQTRLLPSAIDCVLFITSQVVLNSMFLRFRSQTYFESSVSFSNTPTLKDFLWLAYRNMK